MRKITHSSFELDLSPFKLTDIEQNSVFADTIFSKTSFPFDIDVDDDLDKAFDFIKCYTTNPETFYNVTYSHYEILSKATLEIQEFSDGKISCVLEFGLENFPSWDTPLKNLPLDKFELAEGYSIYDHAEAVIPLAYPITNYNFPQIHTDKIDTDDEVWAAFNKIINNRVGGVFLENNVDLVEDITYNRNIMQPVPYLLYVLKKGVEAAGLTLQGDILTDDRLQQQTLYGDVEYFTTVTQESQTIFIASEDFTESGFIPKVSVVLGENFQKFIKTVSIMNPGKYRIKGYITIFRFFRHTATVKIKYRNNIIFSANISNGVPIINAKVNVNVIFETLADLLPNDITIEIFHRPTSEEIICQLDINPIRLHDTSGEAIPNIINLNEINLPKSMPEGTFGDLVNFIKKWFNYDFFPEGNIIFMNKIRVNSSTEGMISLEHKEVKYPTRTFQKGMSFLLKFADIDSKDYEYLPVFQSKDGITNVDFKKDNDTQEIEINGLPLPLLLRNEVQTAHAFENNSTKFYLVKYTGLIGGKNLSQDNSELYLPIVHAQDHKEFMDFRIGATTFKWSFIADIMDMIKLSTKRKIYAYNNVHIIKEIQKTEIATDIFQYEVETES